MMDTKETIHKKAKALRKNMTQAEKRLWGELRRRRLLGCKFRRQQPLGPYIVDFACLALRLIVEVDGGQHARDFAYDKSRDQWLKDQGFIVLRFWNNEIFENTPGVLKRIADEITTLLQK